MKRMMWESAPFTGDHTPIGIYAVLLGTAIVAVVILLILNKRKK